MMIASCALSTGSSLAGVAAHARKVTLAIARAANRQRASGPLPRRLAHPPPQTHGGHVRPGATLLRDHDDEPGNSGNPAVRGHRTDARHELRLSDGARV